MNGLSVFWRGIITAILAVGSLAVWYPAAFVVQHGFDSSAWQDALLLPEQWFHDLASWQILPCIGVYVAMVQGKQIAFADGGITAMRALAAVVLGGGAYFIVGAPRPSLPCSVAGRTSSSARPDRACATGEACSVALASPMPPSARR